jgi:hypothetical protein
MGENENKPANLLAGMDPREAELARQQKAKQSYDAFVKFCEAEGIKSEKQVENLVPGSLIRAAANVVEAKRKLWQSELEAKNAVIRYAIEHKEVLGDHYWQAEHQAYQVYLSAERVYNAILKEEVQ